jgi:hypothetical protein
MGAVYNQIVNYQNKFHGGIAWRLAKHASVIELHLNPDEMVIYAFPGQRNDSFWNVFSTCIVCLTNKRLLIGQKNLIFGYSLTSITPDLFNDMEVYQGLIWGRVVIDTVKEVVILTNLDKHALPEIETNITQFMIKEKQKYASKA